MQEIGRVMVILGLCMAAIGALLWKFPGKLPLGRLPGDIAIEKPGFGFYFPLGTCILVSVILSLLFWLFKR